MTEKKLKIAQFEFEIKDARPKLEEFIYGDL